MHLHPITTHAAVAVAVFAMTWAILRRRRPPPSSSWGARRAMAAWIRGRWIGDNPLDRRLRAAADMLEEERPT